VWGSRCNFKSDVGCGGRLTETMTLEAAEEAGHVSKRELHAEEQLVERVLGPSSELQEASLSGKRRAVP